MTLLDAQYSIGGLLGQRFGLVESLEYGEAETRDALMCHTWHLLPGTEAAVLIERDAARRLWLMSWI